VKREKIRKIQTLRELRALRGEPKRPAHKTVSAKLSHRTLKHEYYYSNIPVFQFSAAKWEI
jgi:hypothetical protein